VVLGPQGKTVEIQIRTKQMHEDAELGVAAIRVIASGALSSSSGRILTEKENVCVGISFPRVNKKGVEKMLNASGW
jgi:hypothetical protein